MLRIVALVPLGAVTVAIAACGSGSSSSAGAMASTSTRPTTLASSPQPTPAGRAAPAACRTGQLTGTLRFGPGSGSAGHMTGALLLRNAAAAACTLRGYPGVSFVDARGHQLGIPAERQGASGGTVTVRPGKAAGAQLSIVDVDVYPRAACRPTVASGLRVYPPDQTAALYVAHPVRVCRRDQRDATIGAMTRLGGLAAGSY
jgi:hypothetical protein